MHSKFRLTAVAAVAAALGIAASAGGAAASPSASTAAKGPKVNLAGICPSTVTIQTDWNPEADHGSTYEMLGPNPTINTSQKSVTGPLYANGQPTGVKLQIRAGGPAIGYSTPSAEMYEDKSITFGYVNTDESIELSGKLPTTAVFAENNISRRSSCGTRRRTQGSRRSSSSARRSRPTAARCTTSPALPTWTT